MPSLTIGGNTWCSAPARDRLLGKPHRQTATLAQAGVLLAPVDHLALLPGDMMAAVVAQPEGQGERPKSDQGVPPTPSAFRTPSGGSLQQPGRRYHNFACSTSVGQGRFFKLQG
jgi:hypothetical protein